MDKFRMTPFSHQEVPVSIRVAQAVGVLGSAYMAGLGATLTAICVPSILQAPAQLCAQQWKSAFIKARDIGVAATVILPTVFGFLAYTEGNKSNIFKYYVGSAACMVSLAPYMILVMNPVNDKLMAAAEKYESASLAEDVEAGVAQEQTVHQLVDLWATLNLVRAAITGASAICAALAVIRPLEIVEHAGIGFTAGAERMGS